MRNMQSVYQLLQNAYIKEIEWPLRIKIARQVSAGLRHLHSLPTPITHNDLKTDNLLLTEAGDVRIIGMRRPRSTPVTTDLMTLSRLWTRVARERGEARGGHRVR